MKALNYWAYCHVKNFSYEKAIEDYSEVLKIDPYNTHALHNKGISFERLGEFQEAIRCFSHVIDMDEKNANAYFNRGCCFDSVGELDLAI